MHRREYLAVVASTIPLAGCTGGPGDPITMLAVNQDTVAHSVTVWAIQRSKLTVASTVDVASNDHAELGEMSWKSGRYRVTVQVDDSIVLAREFESDAWFNQLDVFLGNDGSVELNRGQAA